MDLNLFVPISKVDKAQRMVWGYASTPTLDLDNEIVSLDAIKAALPSYMQWRNVREMHMPSAVGVAKEANVDDKGLYLGAKIVDDDAWRKVQEEVYKGFSIGGKKLSMSGNTITELELIEISLVDRPANPDCRIEVIKAAGGDLPAFLKERRAPVTLEHDEATGILKFIGGLVGKSSALMKREFSDKERSEAAESGAALPDGSFPIKTKEDLRNAIRAHGRAKNKARAKRHIIRRARALGATDMLPDDWKPAGDSKKLAKVLGVPGVFAKAGTADFYTIAGLVSLLASLECAEEGLEGDPAGGHCVPCYFQIGATRVAVSKELTDRFGTLLVQFGDIIADLLDALLASMGAEEKAEAEEPPAIAAAATVESGDDIMKQLESMARNGAIHSPTGDTFAQLKELIQ